MKKARHQMVLGLSAAVPLEHAADAESEGFPGLDW